MGFRVINTVAEGKQNQNEKEKPKMTKAEIEKRMAEIVEEENEIYDELEAIENEEDPWCGTPQSQIDYLNDMLAELKEEYYDLWKELGPDAA